MKSLRNLHGAEKGYDMNRNAFVDRLKKGVLLYDGAMGTMLYERGLFVNRCFEEAVLSQPDLVKGIHIEYIEAGAQILETHTYGANIIKLETHGLADKADLINTRAVEIARKAIAESGAEGILLAGAIGPCGKMMEPVGKLTRDEAFFSLKTHAAALLKAGVDIILLETFTDPEELLLAVKAIREMDDSIAIQAQFSLGHLPSEEYKSVVPRFVKRLDDEPGIDAIGVNCSVGPADMLKILQILSTTTHKPLAVMPNAGFPKEVDGRLLYLATPEYFSEYAKRFWDGGAVIIGGCCGTTPEHISKMSKALVSLDRGLHRTVLSSLDEGVKELPTLPMEKRSALGKALSDGTWITTVELVPPFGSSVEDIVKKSALLKEKGVLCVNLPDGPRASSRISPLITSLEIERRTGMETILHVCCRDKNLIALQADFLGAQAVGLRNMLIITGDPPKTGRYPDVSGVFDVDSIGLLSLTERLNKGIDLGGTQLPEPTSFVCGAGANPASPFLEREIERAFKKAENGAEYFITQPVFDADILLEFLKRIEGTKLPVIAGVWPLASYRNALFLQNEVPGVIIPQEIMDRMQKTQDKEEARREGVAIAREIVDRIRGAVGGIQVSPPFGRIQTALEVLE